MPAMGAVVYAQRVVPRAQTGAVRRTRSGDSAVPARENEPPRELLRARIVARKFE
jgi:hypothetical protein